MPSASGSAWVLPASATRSPAARRYSPSVGSPTGSGTAFQVAPWLET